MKQTAKYKGPLVGLNVIDFGHYYAGPMAAMVLADQGANVIRIVRPGKKELPDQQYRLFNRNKKLLELDLKTEEGKAQALSLMEKADVVIENFRPGVMKRLGLDYASVKAANPGLVYLSLPGFASTDKKRSHLQAWEGLLGAATGIYAEANLLRSWLGYPPAYTPMPICSSYGAMQGVVAVMAALTAREEHGSGTVIETPLVDAGMSSLSDCFIARPVHSQTLRAVADPNAEVPDWYKPYLYNPLDAPEEQERKLFEFGQKIIWGHCGFYTTADDRHIIFTPMKNHIVPYYKALGLYRQLMEEGFVVENFWWEFNDLGTNLVGGLGPKRLLRVKELVAEVIRTKTALEWEEIMAEVAVPFSMLRTRDEWMVLEPMLKSGVLTRMNDGKTELTVPGRVADINGPGGAIIDIVPKEAERITVSQLGETFGNAASVSASSYQSQKKGNLLKGLKVLDLCSILAGPMSAYTLAQYGAEVIAAEPSVSFNVPTQILDNLMARQGKRSLIWDVKTAPGREMFRRLVTWADVIVHNSLDDVAERLGVSQAQVQAINPKVVVCQVTATGGSLRSGWENRPGIDPMGNMPTGQYIQFGSMKYPQGYGGVSSDTMCGISLAFSALLGRYQFLKTGYAGEGRTSLARASNQNQFPWVIAENGKCHWGEATGQHAKGDHALHRMYKCADGWLFVGTTNDKAEALTATTGAESAEEQALEAAFINESCAHWEAKLAEAYIACHRVLRMDDICAEAQLVHVGNDAVDVPVEGQLEVLCYDEHPCGSPVIVPGATWARIGEEQTYKRLSPAVRWGDDTRAILADIGCSENEIDNLFRLRVAHDYLPALGGKDTYFFKGPSISNPVREEK